ncbi:MAG: hypothetical protein ABIR46_00365 [Candidatus Saccharimonadales bacterium]
MDKKEYVFDANKVKKLGVKGAFELGILAGFVLIVIGAALSVTVILAIIGVPLIIAGILAPILAPFMYKNYYHVRCGNCNTWLLIGKNNLYTKVCRKCKTINKIAAI